MADAQAVVVPVASAVEAADSKNKYEVQKCTSYSFVHTFNEMPSMTIFLSQDDNRIIDRKILVFIAFSPSASLVKNIFFIFSIKNL